MVLANKALLLMINWQKLYFAKEVYYDAIGQFAKGLEEYKKALKYNPNDYWLLCKGNFSVYQFCDFIKAY